MAEAGGQAQAVGASWGAGALPRPARAPAESCGSTVRISDPIPNSVFIRAIAMCLIITS